MPFTLSAVYVPRLHATSGAKDVLLDTPCTVSPSSVKLVMFSEAIAWLVEVPVIEPLRKEPEAAVDISMPTEPLRVTPLTV